MSKCINLIGQRFTRLLVVERAENEKNGSARWVCQCDCGNTIVISSYHLRNEDVKSCGCFQRDFPNRTTHGHSGEPIYDEWCGMKARCYNKSQKAYKNYGGRGITVCERWRNNFKDFLDDVSELPHFGEEGYSLERINNDGNYEPSNCKWATIEDQANNKRSNHMITYNGKTQSVKKWADEVGVNYGTLKSRINRGWAIEKALTEPVKNKANTP